MAKKKEEITIRSSTAEYLTYAAEVYRKRKVEGTLKPRRRIQKRLEDPNPIPIIPVKGERKQ